MSSGTLQTPARKRIGARPHSLRALLLRRVLTVIVVALSFHSTAAQTGGTGDQRILHESWTFKDGAPEPVVALAQTADGYLWLGSPSGLFRFDGVRFELFRSAYGDPLPSSNVSTLFAPTTGGLWIGYRFGGLSFLKNGKLTNFSPPSTVHGFAQDRHGIVWAATWDSVWRFDGSSWQPNPAGWNPGLPAVQVGFDRDGILWVLTEDNGAQFGRQLFYLPAGGGKFQKAGDRLFPLGFTRDADSTVLTAREKTPDASATGIALEGSLPAYPILKKDSDQILDRNNGIWLIPRDPFILRHPAGEPLAEIVGKASQNNSLVYDVNPFRYARLVDREGSIWIGDRSGVHRFSYTPLIEPQLPKTPGAYFMVAPDEGGVVWISNGGRGNESCDLYRVSGAQAEFRGKQRVLASFAYRAPDKTLWFGGEGGMFHIVNGRVQNVELPTEMADRTRLLRTFTQDQSGGMWVSFDAAGLYRLKDGIWTKFGGRADLTAGSLIAFTDHAGRIWFGFKQNRIEMLDRDRVQVFGPADGLDVGNVTALYGRGPEIWVGGEFGLEHFEDGRFRAIHSVDKESLRGISGIVETANGDLWLNGLGGIVHLRRAEIQQALKDPAYEVHGERFGRREGAPGLPSQLGKWPTAVEGTDGRLWFTGYRGVVWLDPARSSKKIQPRSVTIQSVSADDRPFGLDSPIRLPAGASSVNISYAAVNLSDPGAIRYRYKLQETDKDWHEAGTTTFANYRNVSPGLYHFVVNASDANGSWSANTATVEFTLLPAYYQTYWFRAAMVALFLLALWALYRVRLHQVAREFNAQLDGRVDERLRVARDLHDTMLQTFQAALIQMQVGYNLLSRRPEKAAEAIQKAITTSEGAIAEGRDAIQNMRSSTVAKNDLARALRLAGDEMAAEGSARFEVRVQGSARDLHPILRDEVYRITLEALRNAFKHAEAKAIEAEILYGDSLRVRIRDDGKGIDPAIMEKGRRSSHYGLPGMRERAEHIGGKLDVWTGAGTGTEIQFSIPGPIAFGRSGGGSLFRRFRRKGKSEAAAGS